MPFFEYSSSSEGSDRDDVVDNEAQSAAVRKKAPRPNKRDRDLEFGDAEENAKKPAEPSVVDVEAQAFDDFAQQFAEREAKKRKRSLTAAGAEGPNGSSSAAAAACAEDAELRKLYELQSKAFAAAGGDDDDFIDDSSDADNAANNNVADRSAAALRQATLLQAQQASTVDDEDIDIDAELLRHRTQLPAADMAAVAASSDGLVLKVQCKHGFVKIRQDKHESFHGLLEKFRAHALKHQWATAKQTMTLQFDGDNISDETPEDLDMGNDEVLDVRIS